MARANLKRLEEGKLYYSISEVCAMTGLEQHVLRYWESEFPQLRPKKNRSGNRAYRNKEIKIIRFIKYLLYDELYTIPGAKKKMADMSLADLEGQMTLLRVASAQPPSRGRGEPAPDLTPDTEGLEEGPEAEQDEEPGPDAVGGLLEPPEASLPGHRFQDVGAATGAAPDPGTEAEVARLRGELARLKDDLKGLLSALETGGGRPG